MTDCSGLLIQAIDLHTLSDKQLPYTLRVGVIISTGRTSRAIVSIPRFNQVFNNNSRQLLFGTASQYSAVSSVLGENSAVTDTVLRLAVQNSEHWQRHCIALHCTALQSMEILSRNVIITI